MSERGGARRVDLLIAGALLLLAWIEVPLRGTTGGPEWASLLLWSAAALMTLIRRAHPLLFFGWALVVQTLSATFDLSPLDGAMAPLYMPLALYGLGAYARAPRRALPTALAGVALLVALRALLDALGLVGDRTLDVALRELAIYAPAAAGGVVLRDRTAALSAARARAAAAADGERGALQLALGAERTRIARELHAVVTGCVRAVLDEVALARSSLARASGSSRAALLRARAASQQAMVEMRRMLVLLRSSESAARPDVSEVPASLRELTDRRAGAVDLRRAHAGAPEAEEPMSGAAMRALVALAELPGCDRLAIERGSGVVRARARVGAEVADAQLEALAERARLAGGRLGRLRRRTVRLTLPAHGRELPPRRRTLPAAWPERLPAALRAQGLPLLIALLGVGEALLAAGKPAEWYGPATVPVRIAGALALALAFLPRRRWPLTTVMLVGAICLVRSTLLGDAFGLNAPLYVAAFVAGAYGRPLWRAALVGVVAVVACAAAAVTISAGWGTYPLPVLLFFATMASAAWLVGVGGRRRLAEAEELRRLSAAEEERRAALIRRAVEAERLRVARELHDLVGHGLTSITLQCAVADQLLESRPRAAANAVAAVEEVAGEVLRELDALLSALDGAGEAQAPELTRLTELTRRAEAHGLRVTLEQRGDLAAVAPGPAGAAYRIVQEALTNARKHGGAVAVAVRVAHERGRLAIEVRNAIEAGPADRRASADAPGRPAGAVAAAPAPPAGAGLGIAGMRERVRLYDGWLDAGPDGAGAWLLKAELPSSTSPLS